MEQTLIIYLHLGHNNINKSLWRNMRIRNINFASNNKMRIILFQRVMIQNLIVGKVIMIIKTKIFKMKTKRIIFKS